MDQENKRVYLEKELSIHNLPGIFFLPQNTASSESPWWQRGGVPAACGKKEESEGGKEHLHPDSKYSRLQKVLHQHLNVQCKQLWSSLAAQHTILLTFLAFQEGSENPDFYLIHARFAPISHLKVAST